MKVCKQCLGKKGAISGRMVYCVSCIRARRKIAMAAGSVRHRAKLPAEISHRVVYEGELTEWAKANRGEAIRIATRMVQHHRPEIATLAKFGLGLLRKLGI